MADDPSSDLRALHGRQSALCATRKVNLGMHKAAAEAEDKLAHAPESLTPSRWFLGRPCSQAESILGPDLQAHRSLACHAVPRLHVAPISDPVDVLHESGTTADGH